MAEAQNMELNNNAYEIIRGRLQKQKEDLQNRLKQLNAARQEVFGTLETQLIANDRILTENSCISMDIISFGNKCIFGYNVHLGLRQEIQLSDVFSVYEFSNNKFEPLPYDFIDDSQFKTDFSNLYKYYRETNFKRFAKIGNYFFMVFQISANPQDVKTFKWLVKDNEITYVDNRSEHEYKYPPQHDFKWTEANREMHRYGKHPHISIAEKVFVETVGGDLTIKIEDNTDDGQGIFSETVEYRDQTLDDGRIRYAEFGNLIPLEIKPFQEEPRYFIYNHKLKEVRKVDSIAHTGVYLPDEQGLIFPTGYYLQTGEYHLFDNVIEGIQFVRKIASPNGEDYLYVFYSSTQGLYNLMHYNVITQKVNTPIVCNGYTVFGNGRLAYFRHENEQTKQHVIQIWQTPFSEEVITASEHQDSILYKIGNKDLVKAMADAHALINLLNKGDKYSNLYVDIAKESKQLLDAYYWINQPETFDLAAPVNQINETAHSAIDEFDRVVEQRNRANQQSKELAQEAEKIFGKIKSASFKSIDDFVGYLSELRKLRGQAISLQEVPYINKNSIESIEEEVAKQQQKVSEKCVQFLLEPKSLTPYDDKIKDREGALQKAEKVVAIKEIESDIQQIGTELELLIEMVSNLKIEDPSQTTQIIDNISLIYTQINQLKAAAKKKKGEVGAVEAKAEFAAQLKLIDQSVFNYFDLADTPEKCDEYQNKIAVQLETLEAKFIDFEEFTLEITEKREEIFASFDNRKNDLIEKKNRRAIAIETSSLRIIQGISNRLKSLDSEQDINAYFATDLMVNKIRENIEELNTLGDAGKAENLETQLKVALEDALRQLKDKQDLFEEGNNVIKLGKHKFGVNHQELDLTILLREDALYYHLTGTDFYQPLESEVLENNKAFWSQDYVSENREVYRACYLAYHLFLELKNEDLVTPEVMQKSIQNEIKLKYNEGYVKGVNDQDALEILKVLYEKHHALGLLTYPSKIRAAAQFFWHSLPTEKRENYNRLIKVTGEVFQSFQIQESENFVYQDIVKEIQDFALQSHLFSDKNSSQVATYLIAELQANNQFSTSLEAHEIFVGFQEELKQQKQDKKFQLTLEEAQNFTEKVWLSLHWVNAYVKKFHPNALPYLDEAVCLTLFGESLSTPQNHVSVNKEITDLKGTHPSIQNGSYHFNYHHFMQQLSEYTLEVVPKFLEFRKTRHQILEQIKEEMRLNEFKPKVLTSFVRNKLIDEVYLPLFGDNLAKQMGSIGDTKRTDRMGLLLLISPPGYGKTTLMEYIANRLGLIFMKINGPSIGHDVTSVDPLAANNSATKQELEKLNLAFEMGNNVMLYLDDIQHCHPEFLQKFISLSDGTRRIEGVFNGKPKTYDLRSKKFCIIMAGNPYTESGERFKIPDMLANRADIYNLGDIIGETKNLFELSLIENSLSSNATLNNLRNKSMNDIYALLNQIETGQEATLEGKHSNQEIQDALAVLEKILVIRNTLLKVNEAYIKSAAMEDAYRTEPPFKLQGSYRDMNKLVEKVVPMMNESELQTLLLTHYESESQTLTSSAEANLLKYKELIDALTQEEKERWENIKETFVKNNKLNSLGNTNEIAQVINQMMELGVSIQGIEKAIRAKE